VHRAYGAFDDRSGTPHEAVFVIDRTGLIRNIHRGPNDLGSPHEWADELRHVR
jgi:hypothetical protein